METENQSTINIIPALIMILGESLQETNNITRGDKGDSGDKGDILLFWSVLLLWGERGNSTFLVGSFIEKEERCLFPVRRVT